VLETTGWFEEDLELEVGGLALESRALEVRLERVVKLNGSLLSDVLVWALKGSTLSAFNIELLKLLPKGSFV